MKASWFGMEHAVARIGNDGHLGMIGIDLALCAGDSFAAAVDKIDWRDWICDFMGRSDVTFGDEIGGHLWLYAEIPTALSEEESDTYLRGLAKRFREAIAALGKGRYGDYPYPESDERGYGIARLSGWGTKSDREVVYEGLLKATSQMFESLQDTTHGRMRVELDRILRESSLKSVYQPITKLSDGRVFGFEALSRCPEDSLFDGPLSLFRFAEQDNQAFALDRLARETAIRNCPKLGATQKIFINVTMGIMNDPHFVSGQTVRWLQERGMNPGQVVFELTERSSIDDFDAAKKILAHYRNQGYEIAIDDAGAGYSSLQSIVELSPDYIKIDRSLIRMADKDDMKKHMLRTFVRFAKKMNIRTVAEGIERPEELRLLRAMGFDFGQGYLLGRPSECPVGTFKAGLPNG